MTNARAAALVLLTACASRAAAPPPVVPPPIPRAPIVVERRACLTAPPPEAMPLTFAACPAGDFVACLDKPSAIALAAYLAALRRYAADAWIACGPEQTDPPKKEPAS